MKFEFEIELDLNKIDYDSINKQITEKVAELNIKDEYMIESRIIDTIDQYIKNMVDRCYNGYIERYWDTPSYEGKNLVETKTRSEIETRVVKIMEDVFANKYNDDLLRELMIKMLPDVFTCLMFSKLESTLYTKDAKYQDIIHTTIRDEIENRFKR